MTFTLSRIKLWSTVAVPSGISVSILTLIVTYRPYAETAGWRIISIALFLVSLLWSLWYLTAKTVKENEKKIPLHTDTKRRRLVLLLPVLTAVLCIGAFISPKQIIYSLALLQKGSIVVFDSEPQGATVKFAWILYEEGDPWLEEESENKKIFKPPKLTLTKTRVKQGQYLAIFELDNKKIQKRFIVNGPTVVKVNF